MYVVYRFNCFMLMLRFLYVYRCKNPSKCPNCPPTKPRRCDLEAGNTTPGGEYTVSVTKSSDQAKDALLGAGSIDIGDNGVYTITKGEDFHVLNIGLFVQNTKRVIIKGFNVGNNKVFKVSFA